MAMIDGFSTRKVVAPVLVLVLAGTACGSRGGEGNPAGTPSGSAPAEAPASPGGSADAPSGAPEGPVQPWLRFDARGGGSSIIQVYRGPSESTPDRQPTGTYEAGQRAPVTCQAIGRTVFADTAVGERPGNENTWYLLSNPNTTMYATKLYGVLEPAGVVVPPCPVPPSAPVPTG